MLENVRCLVFTCPLCGQGSMQLHALHEHVRANHGQSNQQVVRAQCSS